MLILYRTLRGERWEGGGGALLQAVGRTGWRDTGTDREKETGEVRGK